MNTREWVLLYFSHFLIFRWWKVDFKKVYFRDINSKFSFSLSNYASKVYKFDGKVFSCAVKKKEEENFPFSLQINGHGDTNTNNRITIEGMMMNISVYQLWAMVERDLLCDFFFDGEVKKEKSFLS